MNCAFTLGSGAQYPHDLAVKAKGSEPVNVATIQGHPFQAIAPGGASFAGPREGARTAASILPLRLQGAVAKIGRAHV